MRLRQILLPVVAFACAVALSGSQYAAAHNPYPGNWRVLFANEDGFRNYDFNQQIVASQHSDWPMNFLFWNGATIWKVRDALASRGYHFDGGNIWGRMSDGGDYHFWVDPGRKAGSCWGTYHHYRAYGNPTYGNNYTAGWGFYLVGSSHGDYVECDLNIGYHGFSEDVSHVIANDLAAVWGEGRVDRDWAYWYNLETYREEGSHIWQSNGNAHYVNVP